MKKAIAVLMTVLVIAGALIGCGGGAAGTYKFKSMSASGVSYTRETFQALLDLADELTPDATAAIESYDPEGSVQWLKDNGFV